jgi:hypothetical protein
MCLSLGDGGGPVFFKEYYSCRTEVLLGVIRQVVLLVWKITWGDILRPERRSFEKHSV